MAIVFTEWLNGNESRSYPIHDSASRQARDGALLPNNLIVDANIMIPRSAGQFVYISSVGRTSGLFTLTLLASEFSPFCPDSSSSSGVPFVPLAVLRVAQPIVAYKNYAIEALYPGVGGWIALGGGALESDRLFQLFDGPEATLIGPRSVRAYPDAGVASLGKSNNGAALTGLVTVAGLAGVTKTFKATRTIDGVDREVAVIAVDRDAQGVAQLQAFAGECGGRPHVGTCKKAVVTQINNVFPDDDGNIELVIENAVVGDIGSGLVLDSDVSLAEKCETLRIPYIPRDWFSPEPTPSSSSVTPPTPSSSSLSSSSSSSLSDFYCEDFEDGIAQELRVEKGAFSIEDTPRSKRFVSAAGDLFDQYALDRFREMSASASFLLKGIVRPLSASLGEGHLIYGFQHTNFFFFAGLTLRTSPAYPNGRFFLGRKLASGGAWPDEGLGNGYVIDFSFDPGVSLQITDYELTVRPYRIGPNFLTELTIDWAGGLFNQTVVHPVQIPVGYTGLGVVGSETEFDNFGINCPTF